MIVFLQLNTHFTHDLSPIEHNFIPLAKAILRCFLSFQVCEIQQKQKSVQDFTSVTAIMCCHYISETGFAAATDFEAESSAK